jgi:hypothetical protein
MDLFGKESTSVATVTERAKPALITIGDKQMISTGRWNDGLMADYVSENGLVKWIQIGELAKVACGSNTIPNKKRVRARLSGLFMELRNRGMFLAVEYNGEHNSATAVKIADIASEQDRQNVRARLERMWKRKELTSEQYEKSENLINAMERMRASAA